VSGNLGGWTGLIVLVVVLLLFGAPKLPALAKSLGQSLKIFKSEVRQPLVARGLRVPTLPPGNRGGGASPLEVPRRSHDLGRPSR
jgi:sec-independent protein translocase protein TatA